jgi:hypothetical protein
MPARTSAQTKQIPSSHTFHRLWYRHRWSRLIAFSFTRTAHGATSVLGPTVRYTRSRTAKRPSRSLPERLARPLAYPCSDSIPSFQPLRSLTNRWALGHLQQEGHHRTPSSISPAIQAWARLFCQIAPIGVGRERCGVLLPASGKEGNPLPNHGKPFETGSCDRTNSPSRGHPRTIMAPGGVRNRRSFNRPAGTDRPRCLCR